MKRTFKAGHVWKATHWTFADVRANRRIQRMPPARADKLRRLNRRLGLLCGSRPL